MKKRFERYFGNNIGRKIYIASIVLIALGVVVGYGYWWGYGMPLAVIGVAGFLVSYGIQVSDKDIDDHIASVIEQYKEKINGRTARKETLDSRDFSFFYGFLREDAKTRFVAGRDGKVRTSKFYVTAISAQKGIKVFCTVYDLLSDTVPNDSFIYADGAYSTEFSSETLEFPADNKKCRYTVYSNASNFETMTFYVPNDALADKLIAKMQ